MSLTLTEPVKFEDIEKWVVFIIGKDDLLTGQAGIGKTPKEATRKAQATIDETEDMKREYELKSRIYKEINR